jgi:arylsulfatase A-like enzyme
VQAVLNEIAGYDHSGTTNVGVPAIFGMNFQTVSTAQKLPTSDGLTGGYQADGTPGPLLQRALGFIDVKVGAMLDALTQRHLQDDTVVILSAKHGQSPTNPASLTRIDDGAIIDAMNAAWKAQTGSAHALVAFAIDDDGVLMWLNDRSPAAESFAKTFLQGYSGVGNDINKNPKPFTSSGLVPNKIFTGSNAASFIGVPFSDARVPDVVGVAQYGTVYTGRTKKIAEHGGDNPQDRDVALIVSGNPVEDAGDVSTAHVETTQIAPTILQLLGLNPNALEAVQIEHTQTLPISG